MLDWLNTRSGLKFLSVVVAALLWLVVYLDGTSQLEIAVPVETVNVPAGLTIRNTPVKNIVMQLSGPRVRLLFLDRFIDAVRLDLGGSEVGESVFTNLGMLLRLPEDVRINRVAPATVRIILGRKH